MENIVTTVEDNSAAELEKLKRKTKLKTVVLLFLIALLTLSTATLAWFTLNTFSAVDKLEMQVTTGADLRVAIENLGTDISKYYKVLTNEMVNQHLRTANTEISKILLDPLTSSDGVNLFTQKHVQKAGNTGGYLEFPIYFIASKEMYVHLTTDGVEEQNMPGTSVTTTETGIKADVVNAVRVSFAPVDDAVKIYEPNKGTPVANQSTFDISKPMNYSNATRFLHLDPLSPKQVMVRVWIEGEDPQCDDDIQSAQLTVALTFCGTDENNVPIA